MIGCLLLLPITAFLTIMGVYMSSLMAYFAAVIGALGAYTSFMAAYFTALFMWILG
jgi:hypothetical protein